MSSRTLERQQSIDHILAEEQKALREIQQIRERDEKDFRDRILYIEESNGIKIVSYNNYEIETLFRDLEGNEQVEIEEITLDEKNQLDSMYDLIAENDREEITDEPDMEEIEEEKDVDDDFERDEMDDIDHDEEMEYE